MSEERCACILKAKAPKAQRGEPRTSGTFIRNLERDKVSNRFEKDGKPPKFGYRLRPNKWRWDDATEVDGLSVNLEECVGSLRCSILLHDDAARFQHVVVIDLAALSRAIGIEIAAIYDPDPNGRTNPCHFNLRPVGKETIQGLKIRLNDWNDQVCAHRKGTPSDEASAALAERDRKAYERVFRVILDVYTVRSEGQSLAVPNTSVAAAS